MESSGATGGRVVGALPVAGADGRTKNDPKNGLKNVPTDKEIEKVILEEL